MTKRTETSEHPDALPAPEARLDSWKEIAAHLRRGVTTVQRWERTQGLPVHRLPHAKAGSVHAYRGELDAWWRERSTRLEAEDGPGAPEPGSRSRSLAVAFVLLLSCAGAALAWWQYRAAAASGARLAVLPFESLGEAEDAWLADGLTEELITGLAQQGPGKLAVIARSSVAPYRKAPKPIRDVAEALGVDYVLEGSVRQSGGRLRVSAQLIEVANATCIWAEAYEREMPDILALQAEIAATVARRVLMRVAPEAPSTPRPADPEAHVAYLKGQSLWNRRDEDSLRQAIAMFTEAIRLDPGYARAHAGLAAAYASLASSASAIPAREARGLAEASARRALELAPELPEGHAARAVLVCRFDWDWSGCDAALRRVLSLDPNHAAARHWLGEYLIQRGRFPEARKALLEARALDPLSPTIPTHSGSRACTRDATTKLSGSWMPPWRSTRASCSPTASAD